MKERTRGIFALLSALAGAVIGAEIPTIGMIDGAWLGFLIAIIVIGLFVA